MAKGQESSEEKTREAKKRVVSLSLYQVCEACWDTVCCDRYLEAVFEAMACLPQVHDLAADPVKI